MTPLQSELLRLYLPGAEPSGGLVDPQGGVRALVLELVGPPSWQVLSRAWQGVQDGLGLPAPGIAVSGTDGLQLWVSLAVPVAVARGHAFLQGVRSRFLPEVEARRIRLMPAPDASVPGTDLHARPVPALQDGGENWSAFVAPDLAPVFGDTPWLDIPPSEEGQAELLRRLKVTAPVAFETAWEALGLHQPPRANVGEASGTEPAGEGPEAFLQRIMNDGTVPLALRVEAAKALLQHTGSRSPR